MSVCAVCPLMHSRVLRRMEPKLVRKVWARCPRVWSTFRSNPIKGQRSSRSQSALEMPYFHQIWTEEPLTEVQCIADGVKGHAGNNRGQPEVKSLRNALWLPNFIGRTSFQSVMHRWGQRSYWGNPVSTRGHDARNAIWPPYLVGRTLEQSVTYYWVIGHAGVTNV